MKTWSAFLARRAFNCCAIWNNVLRIVIFIDAHKGYKLGSIDEHHTTQDTSARLTEAANSGIIPSRLALCLES
jgi:hypothetical protein